MTSAVRDVGADRSSKTDPSTARPNRGPARPWWAKLDASALELADVGDPLIDALPEAGRAALAGIWQERGGSELRVAAGFAAIASELVEHGASDSVLKIVARAVRDEVHHAEISVEIASRYRAGDVEWPPAQPVQVPVLAPAEGRFRATLLVIAMCCINETLACAILERQLSQTKAPLARAAIQTILSDEIEHARAGWAHIASAYVTAPMKHEIGRWLPRLLKARLTDLIDEDSPFPGEQFPTTGF